MNRRIKMHGRRAMVKQRGNHEASKFEFDSDDGKGVQWQRACSTESVEKAIALFQKKGYTIVDWRDDV